MTTDKFGETSVPCDVCGARWSGHYFGHRLCQDHFNSWWKSVDQPAMFSRLLGEWMHKQKREGAP